MGLEEWIECQCSHSDLSLLLFANPRLFVLFILSLTKTVTLFISSDEKKRVELRGAPVDIHKFSHK